MNRFLIACLACLILFLMFPIGVAAQQSGYVGVGVGSATWDVDVFGTDQTDDSSMTVKLFGGFNLGENFAIELAWADLDQASGRTTFAPGFEIAFILEATAFSAALVGQLPLGETFALFGKAGVAFWDAELTIETRIGGILTSTSASDTGVDPLLGFGLMITPGETFGFRLEYERYLDIGEDFDVDVLSASVLFRF